MKPENLIASVLIILAALWAVPVGAEWSNDPWVNNPVCMAADSQEEPNLVSDGAGGAIIAWADYRLGRYNIRAQRVDAEGNALWQTDGVAVCTATNDQRNPILVSDGAGGAIIVWRDGRAGNDDIYAQRVDASGNKLWATNGVAVCAATEIQSYHQLVSDGVGGAIITWEDNRSFSHSRDIYAQRVDASGNMLWTADGVAVCTLFLISSEEVQLTGDEAGGAIITWWDERTAPLDGNIYAQRVDASGNMLWTVDGVAVCTATSMQRRSVAVGNGTGGAIIAWQDFRSGSYDIYAQRVDASGGTLWTVDGVVLCAAAEHQQYPQLVGDGSGGAIITWEDERTGEMDIYARRIDSSGTALWTNNGVTVCNSYNVQDKPRLVSDGAGGAIITWEDNRGGTGKIYAKRLDGSGTKLWINNGVGVSTWGGDRGDPELISDDSGGAIITWWDQRSGENDIYAQRIGTYGYLGNVEVSITEVIDYPDDQGGKVVMSWTPSYLDQSPEEVVTHYAVWRRLPDPPVWEYVEEVPAYYQDEYASDAPTYETYTGSGDIPWTEYKVVTHTDDPLVFWESVVASGYSEDNLFPGAPQNLAATTSGPDILLTWDASGHHDEDLAFYVAHRSDVSGFTPSVSSQIGTTAVTGFIDQTPGTGTWYYLVTGEDINENEGGPSNEASAAIGLSDTISASYTCTPSSGTVPFSTTMSAQLVNLEPLRPATRIVAQIDARTANGTTYSNWRRGWTNVSQGSQFSRNWGQAFPAVGTVIGDNVFTLTALDVTPAPYNQPPYSSSGDTATDVCTVTGTSP